MRRIVRILLLSLVVALTTPLISVEAWQQNPDGSVVISKEEQESVARLGDDWSKLNEINVALKEQVGLLQQKINLMEKEFDIQNKLLALEKQRAEFYKEQLAVEQSNRKLDAERYSDIIKSYRELAESSKPNFFERVLPWIGAAVILATSLL